MKLFECNQNETCPAEPDLPNAEDAEDAETRRGETGRIPGFPCETPRSLRPLRLSLRKLTLPYFGYTQIISARYEMCQKIFPRLFQPDPKVTK